MRVFVDTSAFYAFLVEGDRFHDHAFEAMTDLATRKAVLLTSNYISLETCALLQKRFGIDIVRTFCNDVLPLVNTVVWVDQEVHDFATSALITAGRRQLSLVDCVSFELMRRMGIETVFAFDRHFAEQGFTVIPATGE